MHSQGCNLISGCYKNSQIVVKGSRLTQIMLHNTPKRNWVQKKLTDCNLISSGCKVQGFRNDCPHLPSEGDESATVATGPKWTDEYQQKWPRTLVQNEPAGCNSLPNCCTQLIKNGAEKSSKNKQLKWFRKRFIEKKQIHKSAANECNLIRRNKEGKKPNGQKDAVEGDQSNSHCILCFANKCNFIIIPAKMVQTNATAS